MWTTGASGLSFELLSGTSKNRFDLMGLAWSGRGSEKYSLGKLVLKRLEREGEGGFSRGRETRFGLNLSGKSLMRLWHLR